MGTRHKISSAIDVRVHGEIPNDEMEAVCAPVTVHGGQWRWARRRTGSLQPERWHAGLLAPGHKGLAQRALSGGALFQIQDGPCAVAVDERNFDPGSFLEHAEIAVQFEIGC